MDPHTKIERCPLCGDASAVRPKVLLIDEAWVSAPGKDERLKYCADLRVDDVRPDRLKQKPLEQFVDGFFCDKCGKGFVADDDLAPDHRRYR